jgi:hypothetical protein
MPREIARIPEVNKAPEVSEVVEHAQEVAGNSEPSQPELEAETIFPTESHGEQAKDLVAQYERGEIDIHTLRGVCPEGLARMSVEKSVRVVKIVAPSLQNPHKGLTGLELRAKVVKEREAKAAKSVNQPAAKKPETSAKPKETQEIVISETVMAQREELLAIERPDAKVLNINTTIPKVPTEKELMTTEVEQHKLPPELVAGLHDIDLSQKVIPDEPIKKTKPVTEISAEPIAEVTPKSYIEVAQLSVAPLKTELSITDIDIVPIDTSEEIELTLEAGEEIHAVAEYVHEDQVAVEEDSTPLAMTFITQLDTFNLRDLEPTPNTIEETEAPLLLDTSIEATDDSVTSEIVLLGPIIDKLQEQPPELMEQTLPLLAAIQSEVVDLIEQMSNEVDSEVAIAPSQELIDICTELFEKLSMPQSEAEVKKFIINLIKAKRRPVHKENLWGRYLYTDSEGDHERQQVNAHLGFKAFVKTHNLLGRVALSVPV